MKAPRRSPQLHLPASGAVAVVTASWHAEIVERLFAEAKAAFETHAPKSWTLARFSSPGSYELPQICEKLARTGKFSAIVPLGCVIRGETSHFDWICQSVFFGLCAVGRTTGVAVSNGVLTTDTHAQATLRSNGETESKGADAMIAALELASAYGELGHD